jgi:hypothetical protein
MSFTTLIKPEKKRIRTPKMSHPIAESWS